MRLFQCSRGVFTGGIIIFVKKILLFLAPLLIAIIIFSGILFFLNKKTGKGALQITSVPKSKVYLENKLMGDTPLCACDLAQMLPAGDYAIKLVPVDVNLKSYEAKITINKGTLTAVERTFVEKGEGSGSIVSLSPLSSKRDVEVLIVSIPDKANVFLDSNPVGTTPLLLKQVSESDHDLRLVLDGYGDKSIRIRTTSGFRLNSLMFLGVKSDLSNPLVASSEATLSPSVAVSKVLILNTPTGFLRVRENDSLNSSEIAQVKPGETFNLLSEKKGWFKIALSDGKEGWISSQYAVKE